MTGDKGDRIFIDKALEIGYELCRQAIWYKDKCSWIDFHMHMMANGHKNRYYRNLSANFYDGTAGISFFLGRLYSLTGEGLFKKTAVASLYKSMDELHAFAPTYKYGFYSGFGGLLYSILTCERYFEIDRSDLWLQQIRAQMVNPIVGFEVGNDIINGLAGHLKTLLLWNRLRHDDDIQLAAVQTGSLLIERAEENANGVSWKTIGNVSRNLTGYAHGAAGIGCSLIDLYTLTGERRFLATALNAYKYEDQFFDVEQNNWPDFRLNIASSADPEKLNYSFAWCHGAPGIALSRLKAGAFYETAGEICHKVAMQIDNEDGGKRINNYSICHGIMGNAQILDIIGTFTGNKGYRSKASEIAANAIDQHKHIGFWRSGMDRDYQTYGYMNGISGIGNFLLNLYEKSVSDNAIYF